jgi:hypothetical protein
VERSSSRRRRIAAARHEQHFWSCNSQSFLLPLDSLSNSLVFLSKTHTRTQPRKKNKLCIDTLPLVPP